MRRPVLVCTLALAAGCAPRVLSPPPPAFPLPEPAPQAAAPEPPALPREIVVVAGGDVTLGHHYEEWVDGLRAKGVTGPAVDSYGFLQVAPVFAGADLVVVNLECPFTERGAPIPKNFNFRARPSTVQVLVEAGVKVVSLANT
jgi:poly-gamma-glutamate synthesis protein (capsule biosynthesis protein)